MEKERIIKFYLANRLLVFPAVVVLASLFLVIFVIFPQTAKLINNQKAMGDLNKQAELLSTKAGLLESYDGDVLSRKLGYILASLPVDKDYGPVLSVLQQMNASLGFSINSVSFNNSASSLGGLGVQLSVKGSKPMFQILLDNLENAPRLIRINNIDISSGQDSQILEATLGLDALYSEPPQNLGSIDSPLPELSKKDDELISGLERLAETMASFSAGESPRGKSNPFE